MRAIHCIWLVGACALAFAACTPVDDADIHTTTARLGPPDHANAAEPACAAPGGCWHAPQSGEDWDRPGNGEAGADNAGDRPNGGNGGPPSQCDADDAYEDNDGPADATPIPLGGVSYSAFAHFDLPTGLHLCSGDDDWYEADLAANPAGQEAIQDWTKPYLFVRATVAGSGLCGAGCEDAVLPDAPENTLTIEVYSSAGELIISRTSTRGNVWITHGDVRYRDNVYLRVTGPAEADYDYRIRSMDLREGLFEDECEC